MIHTKMPCNNYEANRYFHPHVPSPEYARPATRELEKTHNPTEIFQMNAKMDLQGWYGLITCEKHDVVQEVCRSQSQLRKFLIDNEGDSVMQNLKVYKHVNGHKYRMLEYDAKGRRIFVAVDLPE